MMRKKLLMPSVDGNVLCASTTDALVPPLNEWVNSDGETDQNWSLTQVDYEDKRKEYPAPLSLRLMEVDALQKAKGDSSAAIANTAPSDALAASPLPHTLLSLIHI